MPKPAQIQLNGSVLHAGDEGYDAERIGFQRAVPLNPSFIVGAATPDDIVAAVNYAAANDLPLTVQATGHGLAMPVDSGVLVSTRRLNAVRVDAPARIAWVDAGARMSDVVTAAAPFGLAPVGGSASSVGAVSYALGGGLSLMGRTFGYAADTVRAINVVLADGQSLQLTDRDDPDLFWALRGGRMNFGVATTIALDLVPVETLYGGGLFFGTDLIEPALRAYLAWTRDVPDAMTSSIAVIPFPDLPVIPAPLRGRQVAHIRIAYVGAADAGERLVAPLRAVGPRLTESLTVLPYHESASIYNEPSVPVAYYQSNAMLATIDDDMTRAILDHGIAQAKVVGMIEIRHLGGAMAKPPLVANAVGHRDAQYLLRIISVLERVDIHAFKAGHALLLRALEPRTLGYCLNFMSAGTRPDDMHRFYDADAYRRLVQLKATYDPTNRFRFTNVIAENGTGDA